MPALSKIGIQSTLTRKILHEASQCISNKKGAVLYGRVGCMHSVLLNSSKSPYRYSVPVAEYFAGRIVRIVVKEGLWMRKAVGSTSGSRTRSSQKAAKSDLTSSRQTATRWQLGAHPNDPIQPSVTVNRSAIP